MADLDDAKNVSVVELAKNSTKNMQDNISSMEDVVFKTPEELSSLKIIYPGMKQRDVLRVFRDLRTKLLQKSADENFVLMVSSLGVGAGASFVAINMAASFALDENKTAIYIDANSDGSFSDKILKSTSDFGLIDYLDDETLDLQDIIYSSGIPRVRVIPPGSLGDTAVERLGSPRMKDLISALKSRYDDRFIVIDVPPVSDSSMPRILSQVVDMAVLVVPFGKVTTDQILSGVDAVGSSKFAGLVFNND
jgi:protein-tyrosine kinase